MVAVQGIRSRRRRAALAAGGLAFLATIAVLTPAHLALAHTCDADRDCQVCLHFGGNPPIGAGVFVMTPPVAAGVAVGMATIPAIPVVPTVPRGRAPPVPVS